MTVRSCFYRIDLYMSNETLCKLSGTVSISEIYVFNKEPQEVNVDGIEPDDPDRNDTG